MLKPEVSLNPFFPSFFFFSNKTLLRTWLSARSLCIKLTEKSAFTLIMHSFGNALSCQLCVIWLHLFFSKTNCVCDCWQPFVFRCSEKNAFRKMLLGSPTACALISPGWKDCGTEEDLYDQSCLIKEEVHSLSGVICIHGSDVKCLPLKGNRALSLSFFILLLLLFFFLPSIIPPLSHHGLI